MPYEDDSPDGPPLEPLAEPPAPSAVRRQPNSVAKAPTRRKRSSRYVRSRMTTVVVAGAAFVAGVFGLAATSNADGTHRAAGGTTTQTDTGSVDHRSGAFATDNGDFDNRPAIAADPFSSSTSGATTRTSGS